MTNLTIEQAHKIVGLEASIAECKEQIHQICDLSTRLYAATPENKVEYVLTITMSNNETLGISLGIFDLTRLTRKDIEAIKNYVEQEIKLWKEEFKI